MGVTQFQFFNMLLSVRAPDSPMVASLSQMNGKDFCRRRVGCVQRREGESTIVAASVGGQTQGRIK
jgi:hypothetical protein